MTDDPVGEARRLAQNIYVAFSNLRCNSAAADTTAPDALVALVERVVGEREDLYTAAAETNATVAKMQESLDAAIREKDGWESRYRENEKERDAHVCLDPAHPDCVVLLKSAADFLVAKMREAESQRNAAIREKESARAYHEIELDNMRQERDKMKAAWYAVSEKASRYEAERDSNAELWATEKAARDDGGDAIVLLKKMLAEAQRERATEKAAREKAEAARDAAISTDQHGCGQIREATLDLLRQVVEGWPCDCPRPVDHHTIYCKVSAALAAIEGGKG